MLHLMRPVPFQTPYGRACIPGALDDNLVGPAFQLLIKGDMSVLLKSPDRITRLTDGVAGAEEAKPQRTVKLTVLVTAQSSMPSAAQLLHQILALGNECVLHLPGEMALLAETTDPSVLLSGHVKSITPSRHPRYGYWELTKRYYAHLVHI